MIFFFKDVNWTCGGHLCGCVRLCPVLRKAVNNLLGMNVRYYLRAKQKDKADTTTSERSTGSEALGKGQLAPVKMS